MKSSAFNYFKYFNRLAGNHLYILIFLNILIGLLDALGLALFIPLLSASTGNDAGEASLGNLKIITNFFVNLGIELNLLNVLLIMIITFTLKGLIFYIKLIYTSKIRLLIIRKIRLQMLEGFNSISYNGFIKIDPGRIQNNMVGEVTKVLVVMDYFLIALQHLIMLLTYVFLAMVANWKFALLVAVGGFLSNFLYKKIYILTQKASSSISQEGHNFNNLLMQTIYSFKYLKATNYIKKYEKRLKKIIYDIENLNLRMSKLTAISESVKEPLIVMIIAFAILLEIYVLGGAFNSIIISLMYFYRALAHLANVQSSWNHVLSNSGAFDSINKVLKEFKDNVETSSSIEGIKIDYFSELELKNISLKYGNTTILDDISLTIPRKKIVAFVGESGAGKTSLANVICGLIQSTSGSIIIDGKIPLEKVDIYKYRERIGYISQEPVIFNDSIFNNITFWAEKNKESIEKFNYVLGLTSLSLYVNGLENKEDTELGDNGVLISGGQKQRISIARELYKDTDLLIMDEATSALDSETEMIIKENINKLQGKYTMIIIAHRLSTIKNADIIYVLEKGKIIEKGNYKDLLKIENGRFRRMVEIQGN